jgi:hypothetical protein
MIFLLDNTTDKCIEMVPISTSKLWMCSNVLMFPFSFEKKFFPTKCSPTDFLIG